MKIDDLEIYVFDKSGKSSPVIIVAYDIFGIHSNPLQLCDKIAAAGFTVILPDFFRGKPWPLDKPIVPEELMPWITTAGSAEVIDKDVNSIINYLNENGYSTEKLGFLGFCWGGKHAVRYCSDERFRACATAHPSFLKEEDVINAKCPVAALLSKDEAPLEDVKKALLSHSFGNRCIWDRYPDMHHGWCAARGDWSNETQAKRASEAMQVFIGFFSRELKILK